MKLDARLEAVLRFARPGAHLFDVGCDHGKLAIAAAERGISASVTASDINSAPLDAAKANASRAGVSLAFALCDGIPSRALELVKAGAPVDIVVAGMGGENIINMLSAVPGEAENLRLILLPHSKQPEVRRFLADSGFFFDEEAVIVEDGKIYQIITAKRGGFFPLTRLEELLGVRNLTYGRPEVLVLAKHLHSASVAAREGRRSAGLCTAEQDRDIEALEVYL